jgi:UDP-2,3-diacylglucosamine hydrolase
MKTIIVSDVHLEAGPRGRERMRAFAAFLRNIDTTEVNELFLLGDLFDFWFEYRYVIFSGYFDVLRAFAELRDKGVRIVLACGNHDFWAGRFLCGDLGFEVYKDPVILPFGDKRVLVMHGDGINPKDVGYRIFKKIMRNPFIIWLFGTLHPDWAMGIARFVSRNSRAMFSPHDPAEGSESRELQKYAEGVLGRGEADVVLSGHSHHPLIRAFDTPNGRTGLYVNSGDWLRKRCHVEWDGMEFTLVHHEEMTGERGSE